MASLISPYLSIPTAAGRARLAAPAAPRRRRMAVVRAKIREIFMPALSSTMTEGKIVSWTAAEGDRVAKGDPVVVVESDKADMNVETFHDGIVAVVLVPAGGTAPVGAPIASGGASGWHGYGAAYPRPAQAGSDGISCRPLQLVPSGRTFTPHPFVWKRERAPSGRVEPRRTETKVEDRG